MLDTQCSPVLKRRGGGGGGGGYCLIFDPNPQEDQTTSSAFYGLAVSVLGCFGFAFLISSFVVFPVQERECKVKISANIQCILCII